MNQESLIARLIVHEGLKLKPYTDTVGKLTIGIGRNLDGVGISKAEAEALCANDIQFAEKGLDALCSWWRKLDEVRQQVLCEMAFNMGVSRLQDFVKFLAALKAHDFETAAKEMLNSKWAGQVKGRAVTLSNAMRDGRFLNTEV